MQRFDNLSIFLALYGRNPPTTDGFLCGCKTFSCLCCYLNMVLNKQFSCWWFEMAWCSDGITVMAEFYLVICETICWTSCSGLSTTCDIIGFENGNKHIWDMLWCDLWWDIPWICGTCDLIVTSCMCMWLCGALSSGWRGARSEWSTGT